MTTGCLELGPRAAATTVLLAHGAGAPMDSPAMTAIAEALAAESLRVVRFEFAYMADRRTGGARRPPPRADKLIPEYRAAIAGLQFAGRLIIGGKSMGGRVASMVADDCFRAGRIDGLLCLGYPFHPPNRPGTLRIEQLKHLRTPTLICQGTRDTFGSQDDVREYRLSAAVEVRWFEDGDHDLKPRKRVSGLSQADHLKSMAAAVAAWAERIESARP